MSESAKMTSRDKYDILKQRLKGENPKIEKELVDFFREIERTWKKVSPFIGEEDAYGVWGFDLSDELEIKGRAFSFIVWFVLLKKASEKLDKELESLKRKLNRELKWFKGNKEFLDLMVKKYIKEQVKPQKKKEPSYRACARAFCYLNCYQTPCIYIITNNARINITLIYL